MPKGNPDIMANYHVKDELTVNEKEYVTLLAVSHCHSYTPTKYFHIAHERHQGAVKTKKLLSENVLFPQTDKLTDDIVKTYLAFQVTVPKMSFEPLSMSELPKAPKFKYPFLWTYSKW